ncbi:hypothetical protein V9L05_16855 [Bernardetia sp. Wsw4-3y2]|uniref:hypothetical protein n=1 Tax=Bernardetia sp. Wsw4-3y2 TaxID=3127471 RepID=UPI0030D4177E
MSYHSHTLNSVSHAHIIARKDPITGDSVTENDRVVFCAVCKSCFLEDSWIYMNERHCEQSKTLETVPTLPIKLIFKKETTQLIAELLSSKINFQVVIPSMIVTFIITLFSIFAINRGFRVELSFSIAFWTGIVVAILSTVLCYMPRFRNITGNHKDDVRIFKNYIELGRQRISSARIKQIKYQREVRVVRVDMKEFYSSVVPCVLIYFNNGRFVKKDLPTENYKQTAIFLKGLERISYFKEVFFYSENKNEYEIMQNIQSNSNGHIVVGEPARLFHNF